MIIVAGVIIRRPLIDIDVVGYLGNSDKMSQRSWSMSHSILAET
jgi:hypothetical protein